MMRFHFMMRGAMAVILCSVLAGCASQADYMRSLQQYEGLPERAVIDKFGVPDKTYAIDGRQYLSFVNRRVNYYPADTGFYGGAGYGYNRSVFSTGMTGSSYRVSECENTFVIFRGVVERVGFKGNCY